jgi:hypothetical protein
MKRKLMWLAENDGVIRRLGRWMIVVMGLAFGSARPFVWAQQSPEYDNTVGLDPPRYLAPFPGVNAVSVITTSDGFDNFDIGVDFAEPHASTNPRNPLWFFNAFNTNGTHHTENGTDWTTNNPSFPSAAGDPATAYDSLGNLYYMTMKSPITGTWVVRSANNGLTWGAAVSSVNGADKNWMAADQTMGPYANYIYATMTSSTSGSGNFARSTDLGASFTQTFTPTTQSLPGMMVCVGPNVLGGNNISGGCVYVVTNSGSSFAATYTFYRSTNGGVNFTQMSAQSLANYVGTNVNGRNSVQNMRTRPYPFIAADNSFGAYRGRLYVVYASNAPSGDGNKPDIFCRRSTDQGATWSNAVTINDDANPTTHHQWHPSIWCDKETGRLYVKWLDTRNVPTSDSCEVYASYSDDGGVSWMVNQRISNAKMKIDCSTCGGGGTPRYQGDYDAIASNKHSAMLVWTDFRAGTFGSYSAYFPDFAMQVAPASVTLFPSDSTDVRLKVPAVKLYSRSVKFSASVSPPGNFSFSFPQRDSLTSFPDSLVLRIKTSSAALGNYSITITGSGPNGTPVHRRTVAVTVQAPAATITVLQPNGGESWLIGSSQTIAWTSINLTGNVKIELSTNGGSTFPTVIAASTANDGTEPWTVAGSASSTARIRVSSVSMPSTLDISNGNFTITQSSITVTAANGGETWEIGAPQTITWTSTGVSGTVNVELSRNGGSSYEMLYAGTANDGSEAWVVSGPSTATALMRISSVNNPSVVDVSNGQFIISPGFSLLKKLMLHDAEGTSDSLEYGTGAGATEGIDAVFGEYELPPLPPTGVFDVRWRLTGMQGMRRDIRDTLGGTHVQEVYTGMLQPGGAGYPFVLRWNSGELPGGTFTLRDGPAGFNFMVNMKQEDSLTITNPDVITFQLVYELGDVVNSTVESGWNIVSLPVTVGDQRKTVVFPTSVSEAFGYTPVGYVSDDTLDYGAGYWLKFGTTQSVSIPGVFITSDTLDVIQGWNIIGSISSPVAVGSIVQIPNGIVASQYFGYTGAGYTSSTTIDPMKGYWVKVNQNGKLVLTGGPILTRPEQGWSR